MDGKAPDRRFSDVSQAMRKALEGEGARRSKASLGLGVSDPLFRPWLAHLDA
jgi:hypothetical protein